MTDEQNDSPAKTPVEVAVEHAVEALVYAPIGLIFEGASLLPELVAKGRSQVEMARMLGKFAIEQGRGEATKAATKLQDQAAGVLDFIGGSVKPPPSEPASAAGPAERGPSKPPKAPGTARAAARAAAGGTGTAPAPAPPAAAVVDVSSDDLGIQDYDGLSASHVVNRLAGLSSDELESVRQYEGANRGRKTILSKVAQLQAS